LNRRKEIISFDKFDNDHKDIKKIQILPTSEEITYRKQFDKFDPSSNIYIPKSNYSNNLN